MKPKTPPTFGQDIANLVFLALLILIVVFINLTWPVGPIFLIGVAAWLLCGLTRHGLVQRVRNTLPPILFGLGAFALVQLVFNLFPRRIDSESIHTIEIWLVSARTALERVTGWSTPWLMLMILSVLLAVTLIKPQLKLVTRYTRWSGVLASALTALTAATTFTLFSSEPIAEIARDLHAENVERYQSSVRRQKNAVGKYLAANVLKNAAAGFDQAERDRFAALLKKISECPTVPPSATARATVLTAFKCRPERLAASVARAAADEALKQPVADEWIRELLSGAGSGAEARTEERAAPPMPVTASEWRAERDEAVEQSAKADSLADELRRSETAAAFEEIAGGFLKIPMAYVGEGVPFVDEVRDVLADWIVATSRTRGWRLPTTLAEAKLKWDAFIENHSDCCKAFLIPGGGKGPLIANASTAEFDLAVNRIVADAVDELKKTEEAAIKDRIGKLPDGSPGPGRDDSDPLKERLRERIHDAARPERASER